MQSASDHHQQAEPESGARAMRVDLVHVASRLFGAPLMLHSEKLTAILTGLAPRFGVHAPAPSASGQTHEAGAPRDRRSRPYAVVDGVAVVPVVGGLVARAGRMSPDSTELRSYSRVVSDLRTAMADDAVRAVVLDLDSPGGEASGALEAASAVRALCGKKPIVAAVNHSAYSAAYAIAAAADRIVIPPSGGVGSIGVVCAHLDVSKADEKAGATWTFIHAGERKLDGNAHTPLSESARDTMQELVDGLYGQFVASVAAGRGITESAVRATKAGVFFGQAALNARLADRIGTFEDAVSEARAISGRLAAGSAPAGALSDAGGDRHRRAGHANQTEAERIAEIEGLCTLAGMPEMAAAFIRDGAEKQQVLAHLKRSRAESAADRKAHITSDRPLRDAAVTASWNRVGTAIFGAAWKGF